MTDPIDQEVEAIRDVLAALSPLSPKARVSVLEYVSKRLDVDMPFDFNQGRKAPTISGASEGELPGAAQRTIHIKTFKEEKKPRSANEMAALVAYYLSNLAPSEQRKGTIDQQDIETYFKIGEFPLPKETRVTLANARTAGYFDAVGDGEYKLNAVGHNLVAHSMPRGSATAASSRKKRVKKSKTKKPATR